jgi:hypothetical protein
MTEWPKVPDSKSGVPARVPGVRIPFSPPRISSGSRDARGRSEESATTSVCTPPPDEAVLQAAIDRLTRALLTADDATIAELVTERRALREELAELRANRAPSADVVSLDEEHTRRGQGPFGSGA